jgi:hypothetical protein
VNVRVFEVKLALAHPGRKDFHSGESKKDDDEVATLAKPRAIKMAWRRGSSHSAGVHHACMCVHAVEQSLTRSAK